MKFRVTGYAFSDIRRIVEIEEPDFRVAVQEYLVFAWRCSPILPHYVMCYDSQFPLSGHHYLQKVDANDTLSADTIENAFRELHSEVDAVFSHNGHLYMIKVGDVLLQIHCAGTSVTS